MAPLLKGSHKHNLIISEIYAIKYAVRYRIAYFICEEALFISHMLVFFHKLVQTIKGDEVVLNEIT